MSLDKYNKKDPIFIDSSIWLLHYQGKSESASRFINKVEKGEIKAVTSIAVCEEVAFISAKIEAGLILGTDQHSKIMQNLKEKRIFSEAWIMAETHFNFIEELERNNCLNLIREMPDLGLINQFAKTYILLPRDALHAATCRIYGITNIASSDSDFDRVKELVRWKP